MEPVSHLRCWWQEGNQLWKGPEANPGQPFCLMSADTDITRETRAQLLAFSTAPGLPSLVSTCSVLFFPPNWQTPQHLEKQTQKQLCLFPSLHHHTSPYIQRGAEEYYDGENIKAGYSIKKVSLSVIQPRKHTLGDAPMGPCFAYVEVNVINFLFANEKSLAREDYRANPGALAW